MSVMRSLAVVSCRVASCAGATWANSDVPSLSVSRPIQAQESGYGIGTVAGGISRHLEAVGSPGFSRARTVLVAPGLAGGLELADGLGVPVRDRYLTSVRPSPLTSARVRLRRSSRLPGGRHGDGAPAVRGGDQPVSPCR